MRRPYLVLLPACALAVAVPWAAGCLSSDDSRPPPGSLDGGGALDSGAPAVDGWSPPTSDSSPGDAAAQDSASGDASADASGSTFAGGANDSTNPVTLTLSTPLSYMYGVASADGSATLLFVDETHNSPYWSHYDVSTGWSNVAPIPGVQGCTQSIWPSIGVDGSGNTFVAWTCATAFGAPNTLFVARYDHTAHAWGAIVQPDAYPGQIFGAPLAVSSSGEALLLVAHGTLTDGGAGDRNVDAFHYAGGAWTPELVQAGTAATNALEVSLSDTGFAAASWSSSFAVDLATRSGAGTWTPGPTVSNAVGNSFPYNDGLAVTGTGDVLYAYSISGMAPQVLQRDGTAGTWTGPTPIDPASTNYGCVFPPLPVTLTSAGNGVVTHCSNTQGGQMSTVAYDKASKTWGAPAKGGAVGGATGGGPVVRYDSAGNAFAGFSYSPDAGAQNLYTSTYAPDGGWATPAGPVGSAGGVVESPNGRRWVVWTQAGSPSIFVQKMP